VTNSPESLIPLSNSAGSATPLRVIALTDSDSYVKWGAALLGVMPATWHTSLVVVETTKLPSAEQLTAALEGSGIRERDIAVHSFAAVASAVASERPDVVVIATIGPLAALLAHTVIEACETRPVVISGVPGIGLPAQRKALVFRAQADMIVVHSKREVVRFGEVAAENGFEHVFGLATLPFLAERRTQVPTGTDIIFAAQAIVPPSRAQRTMLLHWLVELATRVPDRRVVIKVRARPGEAQTHFENNSFVELHALLGAQAPANLVIESGPMADHLSRAGALVTVSSTAALEAIAAGVPVIALDDFGVSRRMINKVFIGSGLLASATDLIGARFRVADEQWLDENYFHPAADNDWIDQLLELVRRNRAGELPPRVRHARGRGGAFRLAWDRKRVLGPHDRTLSGYLAVIVGTPIRYLILAVKDLEILAPQIVAESSPESATETAAATATATAAAAAAAAAAATATATATVAVAPSVATTKVTV
jgi:hypothetical protein